MHTRQSVVEPALSQDTAPTPTIPSLHALVLEAGDGLYPLEVNLDGSTRHSRHCKALFDRRDWQCRRCCELMRGSGPRGGWQDEYFSRKLGQLQRSLF